MNGSVILTVRCVRDIVCLQQVLIAFCVHCVVDMIEESERRQFSESREQRSIGRVPAQWNVQLVNEVLHGDVLQ